MDKLLDVPQSLIPANTVQTILGLSEQTTLTILILDRSWTMKEYGKTPLECINAHLQTLENPPDERRQFCLVITFADHAEVTLPLTEINGPVRVENYKADGNTLLFETVYQTLKNFLHRLFKHLPNRDHLQICVGVFSDGDDNQSDPQRQPGKLEKLGDIVQRLGWELYTYGIGIDAKKLARTMGFPDDDEHTKTVHASPQGVQEVQQHFSGATTTFFGAKDFFHAPSSGGPTTT